MLRVNSFTVGEILSSADCNTWQDNTLGIAQIPYSLVGAPYMYCDTSPTIKIGGIRGLVLPGFPNTNLNNGGVEISFDATTGGALAADTWYYVYATSSAGVISIGKTTTAPDSDLVLVAAADQRYLGCFKTRVSAATILSFRMVRGKYIYQDSDYASGEFNVLNGGTSATYALIANMAKFIPPHSRLPILSLGLVANSSNQVANFRTGTDSNDSFINIQHSLANTDVMWRDVDFITGASQDVYYKVSSGGSVVVNVHGFSE